MADQVTVRASDQEVPSTPRIPALILICLVCAPGWWAAARKTKTLMPRVAISEPWYQSRPAEYRRLDIPPGHGIVRRKQAVGTAGIWGDLMRYAAAVLAVLSLAPAAVQAEGDPAAGKKAFAKCGVCHSVKQGENKIGPSLFGVVGRPSHSLPNFNYSDAMKAYNVTWDPPTLDHYLIDPRQTVPGTKMIFAGIKNEDERSNIIAYLETLK